MMKVLVAFGTRPEAIKMAPLVLELRKSPRIDLKVCVTGQHRDMLDQVLSVFDVIPDYDLNIMKANQNLSDITCEIIKGMDQIYSRYNPDWVLVHGDTATTLAVSLSSYFRKIKVAHVEAGLRTGNIYSPWPEEANRQVVTRLSHLHFAPTESAKNNLLLEGVDCKSIYVTGNTVIDSLLAASKKIDNDEFLSKTLSDKFNYLNDGKKLILVTGHRRENFGGGFESICNALKRIASSCDVEIIYPVHLNPNVKEPVNKILANIPNVFLIPPQDYIPFIYLMKKSYIILTDSGGIQEEAPTLGKPVLVMRNTTERPEALESGTVKLIGNNEDHIVKETLMLLESKRDYERMTGLSNPYGDGMSSVIMRKIMEDLSVDRA